MTLPGELFAALWPIVEPFAGAIVVRPWDGRFAPEFNAISQLLEVAANPDVPPEIEAYLASEAVPFSCGVSPRPERAFVVMCALDAVAAAIHPEHQFVEQRPLMETVEPLGAGDECGSVSPSLHGME